MLRRTAILALVLGVPVLTSCTTRQLVTLPDRSFVGLSSEQVKQCIVRVAVRRYWSVIKQEPGLVQIKYVTTEHVVVLNVFYSADHYKLEVDDETTLLYEDGRVHRNLNRWLKRLDRDIAKRIALSIS